MPFSPCICVVPKLFDLGVSGDFFDYSLESSVLFGVGAISTKLCSTRTRTKPSCTSFMVN